MTGRVESAVRAAVAPGELLPTPTGRGQFRIARYTSESIVLLLGAKEAWTPLPWQALEERSQKSCVAAAGVESRQQWTGVRLDRLLPGPEVPGRSVKVVSATGFHRRLPRTAAASALLATSVGDAPLSPGHGAPVRLVVPGRRGFWWVKWVDRVEVSGAPGWWQPPLPLR